MISIQKLNRIDVNNVTNVHEKAFKDFFLTTLGHSFLKCYYKAVSSHQESIAYCAKDVNGNIIGFATGSKHAFGYNKKLVKTNFILFCFQAIKLIFSHPNALLRLLRNFEKKTNPSDKGDYAELFSIAVLPEARSLGVGKSLLNHFEISAKENGCKRIALTTDFYNNESVLAFYEKNGYKVFYEFTTYPNRKMYKLIKDL